MTYRTIITGLFLSLAGVVSASPSIIELQPETQVTVSGIVDRITDEDTFVLRDDSGEIEIYLGPNLVPVSIGSAVTVSGIVDDGAYPEIYAQSVTDSDGNMFTFDHGYD